MYKRQPFTLLTGLLSVAMLVLHGAGWLALKIEEGPVMDRARRWGKVAAIAAILFFAIGGIMVATMPIGYRLEGVIDTAGPSNPLWSTSVPATGAWLDNYGRHPWMLLAPILGFAGPALSLIHI